MTADQVLEGIFEWIKDNPWFLKDEVKQADMSAEIAARELLLLLANGNTDVYRAMPQQVRALAVHLTIDFMSKLMGPMAKTTWPIKCGASRAALQRGAWKVVELEIAKSSPPKSTLH